MKVAITGAAGFLGSHLADAMLRDGHEVIGIDNLYGGDRDNVPSGVTFRQEDCRTTVFMKQHFSGCDVVYHLAALPHEGLSVFSPALICENVFQASVSVFTAAIQAGVKRIVFASSMARYGLARTPYREIYDCEPVDPYGVAKKAAEDVLRILGDVHGVEWAVAVPHNIIGPRQKYDDPFRNVASIMINRLKQGLPPIIYGDGNQRRCFSPVDDCIGCLVAMGTSPVSRSTIINIGPDGDGITINELAQMCQEIVGGPYLKPIHVSDRPQEIKHAICSSDRARAMLGYEAKKPLRECLEEMAAAIVPKPFKYHLPLEIINDKTPVTWRERGI